MEAAEVKGIDFTTSPNRSYPNGQFASSFIGLAQLHENEDGSKSLLGTSGMESSLNSILAGTDGIITYEKDRLGNIVPEQNKFPNERWMVRMFIQPFPAPPVLYGNPDGCFSREGKRKVHDSDFGQC